MDLTIAVNNYKNPDLLRLCLNSIKENVQGIEYEIVVSDSATEEEIEMMMREEFPEVKFFPHKENVGFQVMIRDGIENSQGKYILFLNGDLVVTKDSVEKLLHYLKDNPLAGVVGPKLMNFNETLQYSCFRFYKPQTIVYRRTFLKRFGFAKRHLDWFLMRDSDHEKIIEADWIMGSALMIPRSAIEKVGIMDPRFFMYMEDVDWCRRFWESGYKVIYYPFSVMYHYHGKGSDKGNVLQSLLLNKLTWIHISSGIKYFIKYWGKNYPTRN
jgi:GT2 family glycosyltransferase